MSFPPLRLVLAAPLAIAAACVAPLEPALAASPAPASARLSPRDLQGWDTLELVAFERLALERLPADAPTPLDELLQAELEGALATPGLRAVRAAVLLGRSRTRAGQEILLRRLERRVPAPERNADAADVVAAGALERDPGAAFAAQRLADLGSGPTAHPDLEVRVACAAAAVHHGNDAPLAFLIAVLRIDTPAGRADVRDFEAGPSTAWARSQAAAALAERFALVDEFHPDAPIAAREAIAARFDALRSTR